MHQREKTLEMSYGYVDKYLSEYKTGGKCALDLSCGNGALLEILRHYGNEVMGVEIDYFRYLRSQGIPHIKHDCGVLPYPVKDKSYDLVCCTGAISFYSADCASVMAEIFRIARECVLVIVNRGSYLDQHRDLMTSLIPSGWEKVITEDSTHKWRKA